MYTTLLYTRDGQLLSERHYETLARAAQHATGFLAAASAGVRAEVRDSEGKFMWGKPRNEEMRNV